MSQTPDYTHELDVVKQLVQEAGAAAMLHYHDAMSVEYKDASESDPVTQGDRDANAVLMAGLQRAFPADAILSEESPDDPQRLHKSRLWCIDPIDGTRDFVSRTGDFVVMVGLAIHGVATLGVLYHPVTNTLYWGSPAGAYVSQNGDIRSMHVSTQDHFKHATMMFSRAHPSKTVSRIAASLGVEKKIYRGSVGLKVMAIAMGEADVYVSISAHMHEWDICGPEAILKAAGGQVTDIDGVALKYNQQIPKTLRGVIASNTLLHAFCVQTALQHQSF